MKTFVVICLLMLAAEGANAQSGGGGLGRMKRSSRNSIASAKDLGIAEKYAQEARKRTNAGRSRGGRSGWVSGGSGSWLRGGTR